MKRNLTFYKIGSFINRKIGLMMSRFIAHIKNISILATKSSRKIDGNEEFDNSVIGKFRMSEYVQKEGMQVDCFGTVELAEYLPDHHVFAEPNSKVPSYIPVNEEYFEWMDILSSITNAEGKFVFIELGAGYGRWSARAFNAAVNFGIAPKDVILLTVEADPKHSIWCTQHLTFNNVPKNSHIHFQAAISDYVGESEFFVQMPEKTREESEKNWYGQALAKSGWQGAKTETVKVLTLKEIFDSIPDVTIDLIDSDLQGEDWTVLSSNKHLLGRVKKVHVGTDSAIEEIRLRNLFRELGWININDYEGRGKRSTYVGEVVFVDGVQTWLNPKFMKS